MVKRSARLRGKDPNADADDEPAAAPPPPKKKPAARRKKGKEPPPYVPSAKAPLVRVLASEPYILRYVASSVEYRDIAALALVDSGADRLLSLPENGDCWKPHIAAVDAWKGYETIAADQRMLLEGRFGVRRVCAALASGSCRECGGGGAYLNALSCERTCLRCWWCLGSGEHGVDGASRSQMCSVSYAKGRYLITDTDIKSIPVLVVNDETKAHGLMAPKMNVMLVPDAVRLAIARHGSLDAVEAKKAVKHALAMEKYRPKLQAHEDERKAYNDEIAKLRKPLMDKYHAAMKAWKEHQAEDALGAGPAPPYPHPHHVDTSHIENKPGKPPTAPKKIDAAWNFLARNQRARCMHAVATKYGLHATAPPAALATKKYGPVLVCTELTDRDAVEEKYKHIGAVVGFGENLFELVHEATDSSTIVVDMRCDLRKMAKACAKEKHSAVAREYQCTVGGTGQNSTLMIHDNLRFVGMPGSCVYSDNACLWTSESTVLVQLETMTFRTQPPPVASADRMMGVTGAGDRSPCLVLSGKHVVMKGCVVEVGGGGGGNTVLAHTKLHATGSTFSNFGSYLGSFQLHFEEKAGVPEAPGYVFRDNVFVWRAGHAENQYPFGCAFDVPPEVSGASEQDAASIKTAWKARMATCNTLAEAKTRTRDVVFKIKDASEETRKMTGYQFFNQQNREAAKAAVAADPELADADAKAKNQAIMTKLGAMWKELDADAKKKLCDNAPEVVIEKKDDGYKLVMCAERWRQQRPLVVKADGRTPPSALLAQLALDTPLVDKALGNPKAPAPWLYLAASPDGTQLHPLATLDELPACQKHETRAAYEGLNGSRPAEFADVLYVVDRRFGAEAAPMEIE